MPKWHCSTLQRTVQQYIITDEVANPRLPELGPLRWKNTRQVPTPASQWVTAGNVWVPHMYPGYSKGQSMSAWRWLTLQFVHYIGDIGDMDTWTFPTVVDSWAQQRNLMIELNSHYDVGEGRPWQPWWIALKHGKAFRYTLFGKPAHVPAPQYSTRALDQLACDHLAHPGRARKMPLEFPHVVHPAERIALLRHYLKGGTDENNPFLKSTYEPKQRPTLKIPPAIQRMVRSGKLMPWWQGVDTAMAAAWLQLDPDDPNLPDKARSQVALRRNRSLDASHVSERKRNYR